MKKASLAVACVLALIVTVFAQSTGQRRVGWANTVTELLSLTPSKEAYVYVTKGNLYSTNLDGKILAYDPSSTATVNNTNVWSPDSGIGRWLLISTLNGSGGGGGGAITLTVPDGFGVTGSPLTPPGTLGITSTLTNLAKGTGSGFSNAVASVDYVPPGPIGSSGLTMTGTNLLGRYSSGSGAIQSISVGNGLAISSSVLLNTETNGITALTGDGTATGPGSVAFTLANSGVTNGVYGSSTQSPQFSVDSKGRITGVTNVTISALSINPTDGYVPYRTSSTTFGDSPWYRVDTNRLGFNTTNIWLSSLGTNVFIGDSVGNSTLSGTLNIVIGDVTAQNLTSGQKNIVIGNNAGGGLTTGSESIVIGPSANSTASYNVVVGSQAKGGSNGGTTAIGTLANNIAGASGNNVAVGYGALQSGTTASTTVAIGRGALISLQNKDQAVVIGDQAAYNVTDATMGVAIGYQAGVDATNIVQSVIIGGRPFRANSRTDRTVMDSVIIGHKPNTYTNDVASITNSIYIGSGLLPATNNVAQIGTNGVFVLYLNGDVGWFRGTGAPTSHSSGLVTNAPVGSMYSRLDGGAGSSFYVVETSAGNWQPK